MLVYEADNIFDLSEKIGRGAFMRTDFALLQKISLITGRRPIVQVFAIGPVASIFEKWLCQDIKGNFFRHRDFRFVCNFSNRNKNFQKLTVIAILVSDFSKNAKHF